MNKVLASVAIVPSLFWLAHSSMGATAAATSADTLEEIVITAEKRAENLQKVAATVTVLGGDDLQAQAKNTLEDALSSVPGVDIRLGPTAGVTHIVIRGVSALDVTDSPVNYNVDGVFQSTTGAPSFDLGRIEVLKGPQGTLYGRNATGGVVNVINNDPSPQFGATASIQAGNYGAVRTEDMLNLPLNDLLSSRFAFLYSKNDGYLSNGANDQNITAGRAKFLYTPTERLSILLAGEYDKWGGHGAGTVPIPLSSHSDPWYTPDPLGGYSANKWQLFSVVNWDLGRAVLTVEPAYYRIKQIFDSEITGPTQGLSVNGSELVQKTIEARLAQPASSALKWQLGLYYLDYTTTNFLAQPLVAAPISSNSATGLFQPFLSSAAALAAPGTVFRRPIGATGVSEPITDSVSEAAFGQTTIPLTNALRLTAGLRYTKDRKTQQGRVFNALGIESNPYAAPVLTSEITTPCGNPVTTATCYQAADFHATTWNAGIEYDIAPQSMLYANASKGYKSGGLQILPTVGSYGPEFMQAYEIGSKNRFLEDKLQVNLDVYYDNYTDMQLAVLGPPIPPSPFPSVNILNAGKVTLYGFESTVDWLLSSNDQVNVSVAYDHTNVDTAPSAFAYLINNPLTNAPQWTETLGYQHTLHFGNAGAVALGANVRFYSAYHIDVSNYNAIDGVQDAYHLTDAHATYTLPNDKWTVTAYGNNLGNKAVRTNYFSATRMLIGPPRTFGVNAAVKF